jgi:hypothetical protein
MRLRAVGSASATGDRLLRPRPFSTAPYARLVTRSRVLGRRPASTRGGVRRIGAPAWVACLDRRIVRTIPSPHPRPRITDSTASPLRCGCQKPIAPVTCWFVWGAIVGVIGLVALRLGCLIMSRLAGGWFCWRGRTLRITRRSPRYRSRRNAVIGSGSPIMHEALIPPACRCFCTAGL